MNQYIITEEQLQRLVMDKDSVTFAIENVVYEVRSHPYQSERDKKCYDGTECIGGKSDACNICYIPLQKGERISCKLHSICKFTQSDCFAYNPDYKCDMDTRTNFTRQQAGERA